MTYTGIVKGKTIEIDEDIAIPDGTRVRFTAEPDTASGVQAAFDLGAWLEETRKTRERLPVTKSDSVEIVREMRLERANRCL